VSGHWSAWQAARVEVNQDVEAKKCSKQDLAQDVVDKIVDDTDLTATPERMAGSGRGSKARAGGADHSGRPVRREPLAIFYTTCPGSSEARAGTGSAVLASS
jgi:hypothetical protein